MVGIQVKNYPDLDRYIVEEGHSVGNHTYGHITIPNSPPSQLAAQIMRTNLVIFSILVFIPSFSGHRVAYMICV